MNSLRTKNYFSTQGICEIIKECGKSGVTEFSYKELRISFQASKESCKDCIHAQSSGQMTAISNNIVDEDSLIKQDEIVAKEFELEEMKLQDPLQYETLLAERELE